MATRATLSLGYQSDTEPWRYGAEAQRIIAGCLRERERLLPYIYSCAAAVSEEGRMLMRPLVFARTGEKTGEKVQIGDTQRIVSYYIEDGDYWKIDNLTLGYTHNFKNNDYIKSVRLYGSVHNLATFTGYTGLDPEVRITGFDAGTDERDKYPTIRTLKHIRHSRTLCCFL